MAVEHVIEPFSGENGAVTLRVRCSDEQARQLTAILGRLYPGRHHPFYPCAGPEYSHFCRVHDSAERLRGKWPAIELQLLLGPSRPWRDALPEPANGAAPWLVRDGAAAPSSAATPRGAGPRSEPSSRQVFQSRLAQARRLGPVERQRALAPLFDPSAAHTAPAGFLLAETAELLGEHCRAADLYTSLARHADRKDEARAGLARSLLAAGNPRAVLALVAPDEPAPDLRGALGLALLRTGEQDAAIPHLAHAWNHPAARSVEGAIALARYHWTRGQFHAAAGPYRHVLDLAPEELAATDYTAEDFLALTELARCSEFYDLAPTRVLACVEAFCDRATPLQRAHEDALGLVLYAFELARLEQRGERLANAYHNRLDDLLRRREGTEILELLANAGADYHRGLLSASQRFDLLDEVDEHRKDYGPPFRLQLIDGYRELLEAAMDVARPGDVPLSLETRDLYRALNDLDPHGATSERYRLHLAERSRLPAPTIEEPVVPPGIAGKHIALVGGHGSMLRHVAERLEGWGAAVTEVPPPSSGRTSTKELLGAVQSCDLVLLITGYMGHDMSTIVTNLNAGKALRGRVLKVECRGTSGVTRAILEWAENN